MATMHTEPDGRRVMYVKGAPDRLMPLCKTQVVTGTAGGSERAAPLDAAFWQQAQAGLSSKGLRVLALCRYVCVCVGHQALHVTQAKLDRGVYVQGCPPAGPSCSSVFVLRESGCRSVPCTVWHAANIIVCDRACAVRRAVLCVLCRAELPADFSVEGMTKADQLLSQPPFLSSKHALLCTCMMVAVAVVLAPCCRITALHIQQYPEQDSCWWLNIMPVYR